MAWTNLPTDYTDAVFSGLRKYVQVDNADGTISFQDVTLYENREKSFFGAGDANKMNGAINEIMNSVNNSPSMGVGEVTLTASAWSDHNGYFTQSITIEGAGATDKVDIQPNADALVQLMSDGVAALYIENNDGALTAYSVGGKPSVNLTVQVTMLGVPSSN